MPRSRPVSRPLVGLTTSELRRPERIKRTAQSEPAEIELALNLTYPSAIERAGGVPVIVPPLQPDAIDALLSGLQGLVLTGGPDLHPSVYEASPHENLGPTEQEIDLFELALLQSAERVGIPVLCICRGMQALNVARGGTLIQDLPTERQSDLQHRQEAPGRVPTHPVTVAPDSTLAGLLGRTELEVNSFHHQAVDRLGDGLRIVAEAPDGVVEAIESTRGPFMVGVQWHAESLIESAEQRTLLQAFVAAASEGRGLRVAAA
ncbi:MAG: gamma-glutamyl-gamma-aminobutyrate hydrolase family protein [Solirubrobacteraceae bacterium]|nr:gamma-glutamyl-gamma-aminobutyrate hydrolase family protein [Solirubrobacteraceae bacterium]